MKLFRPADAAGAGGSRLGGLGSLAVRPDKALEIRVLGALQAQLLAPGHVLPAMGEERRKHDGLVDVGHPHAVLDKVDELIVGHLNTLQRKPGTAHYGLQCPT